MRFANSIEVEMGLYCSGKTLPKYVVRVGIDNDQHDFYCSPTI